MASKTVSDLIRTHGEANGAKPTHIYVHNTCTHRIFKRDPRAMHRRELLILHTVDQFI